MFQDGWKPLMAETYGTDRRKFNDEDNSTINEEDEGRFIIIMLNFSIIRINNYY